MPDLDLSSPVTGGYSGGEDGMLGYAQAGLSVGVEGVQQMSIVVIIEMSGATGASRGQDASIRGKLALYCVSLHLERGYTL